jgi:hypothetical protein
MLGNPLDAVRPEAGAVAYHGPTSRGTRAHASGLERDSPAWERAWSPVPDLVLAHPERGACLPSLGSTQERGGGWAHVVRHRQMPGRPPRQFWCAPASAGWIPGGLYARHAPGVLAWCRRPAPARRVSGSR